LTKIILFDLDGTIIDSTEAIVETFFYVFSKKGFEKQIADYEIKRLIGYPLDIMFANLGVEQQYVDEYVNEYKLRYREVSCAKTVLIENALKSLEFASKFARLGVVTTKTALYSHPLLEHLNVGHYFECLIGREHVINPKPHPEPIYKAIESMKLDINKHDIYMIGDTKLDLIASGNAGIKGIGVLSGYGTKEELSLYSDKVFKDTWDAVNYLYNGR
jgi:phosphoglycolate phosphatase